MLNELEALRKKGLAVENYIAAVYLGLGEIDKAFEFLERAFAAGNGDPSLNVDPFWQEVHQDPRAQALLRKMNLVK